MPSPATIPASLFLRSVLVALDNQIERTLQRLKDNPRQASHDKDSGRVNRVEELRHDRDRVRELMRAEVRGDVRADVSGLVVAVAFGHNPAWDALNRLLGESGHPAVEVVAGLRAREVGRIVAALLGRGESGTP